MGSGKMSRKIETVLIILLVASLVTSSIYLYIQNKKNEEQEEIFEELASTTNEEKSNKDENNAENEIDLEELYNRNSDFVGWLKIADTNINYPVMQTNGERKDYYLYRNFYKEYSQLGTPYIAENCNIRTSDNLIIYGHHITRNRMFGELEKYKNKNFYETHKIINFDTIYEKAKYEIISVFKTIVYSEKGFNYYENINFNNKNEFDTFIEKCKELSIYDIENTAKYGDKLITLSTCEYSRQNGRLVVVAKKITNVLEE